MSAGSQSRRHTARRPSAEGYNSSKVSITPLTPGTAARSSSIRATEGKDPINRLPCVGTPWVPRVLRLFGPARGSLEGASVN